MGDPTPVGAWLDLDDFDCFVSFELFVLIDDLADLEVFGLVDGEDEVDRIEDGREDIVG